MRAARVIALAVVAVLVLVTEVAGVPAALRLPRRLLETDAEVPPERQPEGVAVATIYSEGLDPGWRSWSWGLSYFSTKDGEAPLQGSRYSLCLQVQPYGALSLKSSVPFSLNGILGFYIKGGAGADSAADNSSSAALGFDVGDLELQFESSSPSAYTISKSITLREVLEGRAAVDGTDAEAELRSIERGEWNAIKVDMKKFTLGNPGARYDRLTLGSCIQNLDSCTGEAPPELQICLDKMVMVDKYQY